MRRVRGATRQAWILAVAVVLVLLVVCVNVATLLVSRATARQREVAVRQAMGATRRRLIRQLLTEGGLLSVVGGAGGLVVAHVARGLLPFGQTAPFDARVFGFVTIVSGLVGVVCSLAPALHATRIQLASSLSASGRTVVPSQTRLGRVLVVVQVAVAFVLIAAAGLFLKTLDNLRDVDIGFDPEKVLMFRVAPDLAGYTDDGHAALYEQLADRVSAVPGVVSVGLSQSALGTGTMMGTFHLEREAGSTGRSARMMVISPDFLRTVDVPVLSGRGVTDRDGPEAPRVALVNATAAREWFADAPLGQRLGFSSESRRDIEIVGVVSDTRYASSRAPAPPMVYLVHAQRPTGGRTFVVKTAGPPGSFAPGVREAVRRVDANLPLLQVRTLTEAIETRFSQERLLARAYALFGGVTLGLARYRPVRCAVVRRGAPEERDGSSDGAGGGAGRRDADGREAGSRAGRGRSRPGDCLVPSWAADSWRVWYTACHRATWPRSRRRWLGSRPPPPWRPTSPPDGPRGWIRSRSSNRSSGDLASEPEPPLGRPPRREAASAERRRGHEAGSNPSRGEGRSWARSVSRDGPAAGTRRTPR